MGGILGSTIRTHVITERLFCARHLLAGECLRRPYVGRESIQLTLYYRDGQSPVSCAVAWVAMSICYLCRCAP